MFITAERGKVCLSKRFFSQEDISKKSVWETLHQAADVEAIKLFLAPRSEMTR